MTDTTSWPYALAILGLGAFTLPVVGDQTIKPSAGFQIIWQGDSGSFVEYAEKLSRRSIIVTLHARNFDLKTKEGLQLAKSALDQATQQVTLDLQRLPQYAGKRVTESRREDQASRKLLTRTVEFMCGDEKALAAAEEVERKRREEAEQAERQRREKAEEKERKQARERVERERQRKEKEERDSQERDQKEGKKTDDPKHVATTRPLRVRIASTGPDGDPATESMNRCLRSVKAAATDHSLSVAWDVDSKSWPSEPACQPLSVTLLDRNGRSLARFTSPDWFTAEKKTQAAVNLADTMSAGMKPILLRPTGNALGYEVDRRLLQETMTVEVGFAAPP